MQISSSPASAFASAQAGMAQATSQVDQAASQIASQQGNLTSNAVALVSGEQAHAANAKVLEAASGTVGHIIDIMV